MSRARGQVDAVRDAMLSFARCFGVNEHKAIYVSTPITTGRSFLAWRQQDPSLPESHPTYKANHRKEVVEGNLARAIAVVRRVRASFPDVVIDPTRLDDVDGWEQNDYHQFWAEIVARFVHTVVLVDGWQYSTGCALEFATAVRHRLRLLDEQLRPVRPAQGIELLNDAIRELDQAGLDKRLLADAAADASAAITVSMRR